ncbi:YD repeat-containing protein [Algoriphagus sp. 4150]|uniref:RHS repeat domain-containing protein n=1 Tax=Algoriphagus sp. 4150 TaxID=2817756 RepID=UPI00285D2F85|nr:RHS repeat domain-containing protein [Algoriphagus sp. 4150]MDR7130997.1 YD repeat-containing protein [Algoriphagus sp. 4150]
MKLLVFFISLIVGLDLYAQDIMQTHLENYMPPSPTAQEFIKYGEYPVSHYTGVPDISIPLYQIKYKDLSVPLSISYHSSGILVDQQATWIGLGWSLNAGGTISRVPRGNPDGSSGGFLVANVSELDDLEYDSNYFEQAATGQIDTESDIYYYNFSGYTGQFFFGRDKKVRLINEAPIEIEYSSGAFMITVENGSVYEFNTNSTESTRSSTYSFGSEISSNYVSTWHLSKITSKHHTGNISFLYENENPITSNEYDYTESTGNYFLPTFPPTVIPGVHHPASIASHTRTQSNPKRLKEINFPNGKVIFNRANDRLDGIHDRLDEIIIYQNNGSSVYSKLKSYTFIPDHYYSSQTNAVSQVPLGGSTDYRRYRLKLKELVEYDLNGSDPKKHVFDYNTTMLPPLETNAKDYWGYYNGKSNNSLIPKQPFHYMEQQVGSADRNPDALYMKAGVLEKVTYPTGGYTEFYYEPNEYITSEPGLTTKTINVSARGDNAPFNGVVTFTPTYSGYATVIVESSDMIDAQGGTFPRITLQREGYSSYLIDHRIDPYTYTFPLNPPTVDKTFSPVYLIEGQTYVLKVEVKGSSSSTRYAGAAFINAHINYQEVSSEPNTSTKLAGGLRVTEIKSFTKENILGYAKKYKYKNPSLITPEKFINEHFLDSNIQGWKRQGGVTSVHCTANSTTRRFYYGGTVRSLTLYGGSAVVYATVDEIQIGKTGQELGKTIYHFSTHKDAVYQTFSSYKGGLMLLKKDWTGGQLTLKEIYKNKLGSQDSLIYSEMNDYIIKKDKLTVYNDAYKMYKIVHKARIFGDCRIVTADQFEIIEYPIFSGVKLLKKTESILRDDLGLEFHKTRELFYDNELHLQPTRDELNSSEGDTFITKTYFPDDIVSSTFLGEPALTPAEYNAIVKLKKLNEHRVGEPIQIERWKDNKKLFTQRTSYKEWGNGMVLPELIKSSNEDSPLITRMRYHEYDNSGNPLLVSNDEGTKISYVWDYNSSLLVAEAVNATNSQIAFTSFETSDKGGWTYSGTPVTTHKTGTKGYSLGSGQVTKTGIAASVSNPYRVGFWAKRTSGTGNVSVSGQTESLTTAWKWVEKTITTSSLTITGSSVVIDELRLHPADAMMTSYTYDPLVGMTSKTDPRGFTVTYEYDASGRLKTIKNEDGHILEHYEYNYASGN